VVTAIQVPANNASAITVKVYDTSTTNQREVLRSLAQLTRKTVDTLASDDISFLSDPDYGMINVVMRDLFAHMANKYGVLNQSDINLIFEKLDTVKTPTQDFSVLAELHRDLHGRLACEYLKPKYLADALNYDPAGLYAIEIFYRSFPAIPEDRTFEDLIEILTLHAPTFITTNSTFGYSNAMATTASALAAPLMDAAGHAQIIAKHQKELAALNKKNGVVPRPRSSPKTTGHKYCYVHGYQKKSRIGTDCNVLKANAQKQYTAQHLAATDHLTPAGGNPNVRAQSRTNVVKSY
jgi:hypothetical protein